MDTPKNIQSTSSENFKHTDGRGYTNLEALDFIERYTADPEGYHKGLHLMGGSGIGETYLLGVTARKLAITRFTTVLVHLPTFTVEMKQAIGKDQVAEKLDAVRRSPTLMIGDIGTNAMNSRIRDEVFGVILQYRMQRQLPTFFLSDLTMDELEQRLSVTRREDGEPLKAKHIMERIRHSTKGTEVTGRSHRNNQIVDKFN